MKKLEKRLPYFSPQITTIKLRPEQAILSQCHLSASSIQESASYGCGFWGPGQECKAVDTSPPQPEIDSGARPS